CISKGPGPRGGCCRRASSAGPRAKQRPSSCLLGLWRNRRDSNPRYSFPYTGLAILHLQPLGHDSGSQALGCGTLTILVPGCKGPGGDHRGASPECREIHGPRARGPNFERRVRAQAHLELRGGVQRGRLPPMSEAPRASEAHSPATPPMQREPPAEPLGATPRGSALWAYGRQLAQEIFGLTLGLFVGL